MRITLALSSMIVLAGCMEPQVAPDLPTRASTEFSVTEIAGGLSGPWSVAPLDGGGALVTEKSGRLLRVDAGGAVTEVSGVPGDLHYVADSQSQAGLFDVVPAPDFAQSGRIYLSYAYGPPEANGTALASARLVGDRLEDVRTLFQSSTKSTNAHYGAKIVVEGDGSVLLTTGDAFVLREQAQDPDSTHGKLMRVRADGSSEIVSLGHRNMQGLARDPVTGVLWEHEHGPRGGDEVNIIEAGANYGWPIVTRGVDYNGMRISAFETSEQAGGGFVDPAHNWTPSIAPSGLAVYRGDLFSEWDGDLLVGALAGRSLRRLDVENGQIVGEEVLLADLGERIRDVRVAPDGSVWVLTNGNNEDASGEVLRIAPRGTES